MSKKAFTLIELLVVLSIVGILAGFVFVQTNNAVNSGKDAKRKSDIALLASAAVGYQSESITMPISSGCSINVDCPTEVNQALEGQLGTLPVDPNSGSSYRYQSDTGTDCTISAVLSTGETYQYSCNGDEMSQSAPLAGVCGSRANNSSSGYPSSQTDWTADTTYCASTIPSTTPAYPSTPGSSVSWTCPGTYLGSSTICTAYRALNGVCGSGTANTYTIPTVNFCSTGTASSVSGSGPWSWTCEGVYGGTTPTCVANKSIDGICGTSNNGNYYDTSSITAPCSIGTASAYSGSGPWSWTCEGVYGGTTPTCTANKKIDGVCGTLSNTSSTAYAQSVTSWPSANYCSAGTASSTPTFPSAGTYVSWTCTGVYGGNNSISCNAYHASNGVCGSAAAVYSPDSSSYGSASFCSPGTASPASPSFPGIGSSVSWTCSGTYGGSLTCTASRQLKSVFCKSAGGLWYWNICTGCNHPWEEDREYYGSCAAAGYVGTIITCGGSWHCSMGCDYYAAEAGPGWSGTGQEMQGCGYRTIYSYNQ